VSVEVARRLVFDVSTIADWVDTPVGTVRIERALAARARLHVHPVVFAVFDPNKGAYREIRDEWRDAIIAGKAVIDPMAFYAARSQRSHLSDRIPQTLRPLLNPRRALLMGLERLRVPRADTMPAKLIDILQRGLMSKKYSRQMLNPDGGRRGFVSYDLALGAVVSLAPDDILVCVGWQWQYDMAWLKIVKAETRFKFVLLCHDILMLLWPTLYGSHRVSAFRKWIEEIMPLADLVIFTTETARADTVHYCDAHRIAIRSSRVVRPGVEKLPRRFGAAQLPSGIEAEHYALCVGVLDRRKGHRLLYEIWLRLLAEGVPQHARFKLVLVGEPHGIDAELLHAIQDEGRLDHSLKLLQRVGDAELAELYFGSAFCLFPSLYEGYGLPIIEAFNYGKAVIASTGGALPEVVGGLSPCLDPSDSEAWYRTLKAWILNPAIRRPYEEAIKATFRHPDWDEAAATFFDTIEPKAHPIR
jgi:glycosyltransferase involved in cell wall biosynthesis